MRFYNKIVGVIIVIILIYNLCCNNNHEDFRSYIYPPFPIDIVYTWAGENNNTTNARISNNNELKYSLRSVMKYAPWVNRIYILMNPVKVKPSWFNDKYSDKITLVDHNDTFRDKSHLPTTNSNSIETTVANIATLSEHFIYFNDDFYLGNDVSYRDFFNSDGSKIVINSKMLADCKPMYKTNNDRILNIDLPIYCGIADHTPFPNKKSIITEFQSEYSEYIEWVRNIKERSGTGGDTCDKYNLHEWCQQQHALIAKYAYDTGNGILHTFSTNEIIYADQHYDPDFKKAQEIERIRPRFFCINDMKFESDEKRQEYYRRVNTFMEEFYKEIPFFENQSI
jgi:hypothetical protein